MRIQKRNPDQTDQPTCSKRLKVDTFGGVDHGDNSDNNKDGKRCNGKGQCKCRGFDPQFQCTNSTKLERANISMQRQHYRRGRNMGVQTDFDMSDTTSSDLPGPSTNNQGSNTQQQSGSNQNDELITTKTTVNASEVVSKNNADTNVESNNIESTDNQNVTDNTSLNSTDDKEMSGTNNIESTDSEEQQTSTNSSSQNITNEEMDNTNDYENTKHLQNSGTNTTNESNEEGDNTNRSEDGNEDQGNQNEQEQVFYYFF